jgi:hypothetical protein
MPLETSPGKRVNVTGLAKRPELNGALGVIVGAADAGTGRIPVHLITDQEPQGPRNGILIKPDNLQPAAPQIAVRLEGIKAVELQLSAEDTLKLHINGPARYGERSSSGWMSCRVPSMLGLPLTIKQLAPTTHDSRLRFEQPAVLLLINPGSGFAPDWVQWDGLGPILVARSDGEHNLLQQHDLMCRSRHQQLLQDQLGQRWGCQISQTCPDRGSLAAAAC